MTPELAAERAADILAIAEHADNDRAIALVAVGDAWTRLHTALANAPKTIDPATPASAEALKHQLDEQQGQLAWLHSGYLNLGYWHDRAVCGGCMATIEHAEDVEAYYRLVPIEGLTIRDADGDDDAITDQGVIDVDPAPLISYYEARRHH